MCNRHLTNICLLLLTGSFGVSVSAQDSGLSGHHNNWVFGGHSKYQYTYTAIPENSVINELSGSSLQDHDIEFRLKISNRRGPWDFSAHAQLIAANADSLYAFRGLPDFIYPGTDVINDKRRWFNLTHEISNKDKNAVLARLDRVSIAYSSDKAVIRFGRQAISWGNSLLFTPMDILNPFDPAAVDKEYKTGDDMLYGQYLFDNGNDLQAVTVVRRNPVSGEVEGDQSSLALKYHGFWAGREYDLLAAQHYGEALLAVGLSGDLGGAVLRGDLVWNDTDSGAIYSAVAGLDYSWVGGGRNWMGTVEYFYNGFGQADSDYSAAGLAANPELLERLARGELFNIGRHYLGASVTLEATPLLNLTPNIFVNLIDPSAYAQLVASYSWKQDIQLLAALSFPIGPGGSEYGGIEAEQPGSYVSSGPSLFVQLAWYF